MISIVGIIGNDGLNPLVYLLIQLAYLLNGLPSFIPSIITTNIHTIPIVIVNVGCLIGVGALHVQFVLKHGGIRSVIALGLWLEAVLFLDGSLWRLELIYVGEISGI